MIRTYQLATIVCSTLIYDDAVQLTCQDNKIPHNLLDQPTRLHIRSGSTTLDATRLQQSIVVTHQ
jgi:hypothetical protein